MLIRITSLLTLLSGGRQNLHSLSSQLSQAAVTAYNRVQLNTMALWSGSESAHFLLRKNDEVGLRFDVKDAGIYGQHVYLPCNETQFRVNDRKQTQKSQK